MKYRTNIPNILNYFIVKEADNKAFNKNLQLLFTFIKNCYVLREIN